MMKSFEKKILFLLDQESLPKIKISSTVPKHQVFFQDRNLSTQSRSDACFNEQFQHEDY
jgi:hypothetical protein